MLTPSEEFSYASIAVAVGASVATYFAGFDVGGFPAGIGVGLWLAGGWMWLRGEATV